MPNSMNNASYSKGIGFVFQYFCRRLDYDNVPNHTYNFTIVATDNGSPSHQGYAMVRVSVTNVNDEDPVFVQPVEVIQVSEDAPLNTVIHVIQAYDPDGDSIIYAFSGMHMCSTILYINSYYHLICNHLTISIWLKYLEEKQSFVLTL